MRLSSITLLTPFVFALTASAELASSASAADATAGAIEQLLEQAFHPSAVPHSSAHDESNNKDTLSSPATAPEEDTNEDDASPENASAVPSADDERALHESPLELPGLDGMTVHALRGGDDDAALASSDDAEEENDNDDEADNGDAPESDDEADSDADDDDDEEEDEGANEVDDEEEDGDDGRSDEGAAPAGLPALLSSILGGAIHPEAVREHVHALPAEHPLVIHLRLLGHPAAMSHPQIHVLGPMPVHPMPFHLMQLHTGPVPQPHPLMMMHLRMLPPHLRMLPPHLLGGPMHMFPPMGMMLHGAMMPPMMMHAPMLPPPMMMMMGMHHQGPPAGLLESLMHLNGPAATHGAREVEEITFHNGKGTMHKFGVDAEGRHFDETVPLHEQFPSSEGPAASSLLADDKPKADKPEADKPKADKPKADKPEAKPVNPVLEAISELKAKAKAEKIAEGAH